MLPVLDKVDLVRVPLQLLGDGDTGLPRHVQHSHARLQVAAAATTNQRSVWRLLTNHRSVWRLLTNHRSVLRLLTNHRSPVADVDGGLLLVPGEYPHADPRQPQVDQSLSHPVLQRQV